MRSYCGRVARGFATLPSNADLLLLGGDLGNDDGASDPVAGITGRIGDIVICSCVNDDSASIGVKNRCLLRNRAKNSP